MTKVTESKIDYNDFAKMIVSSICKILWLDEFMRTLGRKRYKIKSTFYHNWCSAVFVYTAVALILMACLNLKFN